VNEKISKARASSIRRKILEAAFVANRGHIGSALSIVELLVAVFEECEIRTPEDARERVVLSKGHAALALYATLEEFGLISRADILSYCSEGSLFQTHPDHALPSISFTTGSLGQGIGFASGLALARRLKGQNGDVVAILSDSELNEGSTWETAMIAGSQSIGNFVVILDNNGQQALGMTKDVIRIRDIALAWEQFGWISHKVDGHDVGAIRHALSQSRDEPLLVVASTVAGKGVDFMEGRVEWHYLPQTPEQNQYALEGLDG